MHHSLTVWLLLMVVVAVSFFLSGLEAGLFALNPVRIRTWMRQGRSGAAQLHRFLQDTEGFLWTILVGNTLANCVAVVLAMLLMLQVFGDRPLLLLGGFVLGVFVFHAMADLLPKMIFQTYPNRLCLLAVRPFRFLHALLSPLVGMLQLASRLLMPRDESPQGHGLASSREEFRLTLQEAPEGLTSDERLMIGRVLDLRSVKVGELATPMAKVVTVEAGATLGEVLALARKHRVSRLPVWEPGEDRRGRRRIAGVISLKTFLFQSGLNPKRKAAELLKSALFLAEESRADEALQRMRRSGQRLAIVLGNGRREVGVVSLEDLLRYLFGEVKI